MGKHRLHENSTYKKKILGGKDNENISISVAHMRPKEYSYTRKKKKSP